jgi:hypothetical protein
MRSLSVGIEYKVSPKKETFSIERYKASALCQHSGGKRAVPPQFNGTLETLWIKLEPIRNNGGVCLMCDSSSAYRRLLWQRESLGG